VHRYVGLLLTLFICCPLVATATTTDSAADLGAVRDGRWALAFVVVPDCPACDQVIEWFGRAAEAFPEVNFALVAPEFTSELLGLTGEDLLVLHDAGTQLGSEVGVTRAPTVSLLVEGVEIERLDWPFAEGLLLRKLAESLLVEFPTPSELLGQPAPGFSALSLEGQNIAFADLNVPLLLAFLALDCAPCWEALPVLAELSRDVPVVSVGIVGQPGLSDEDGERLAQFLEEADGVGGEAVVLLDLWDDGIPVSRAYKVRHSLTFVLADGKGVVAEVWEGVEELESLGEELRASLAEARSLRGEEPH